MILTVQCPTKPTPYPYHLDTHISSSSFVLSGLPNIVHIAERDLSLLRKDMQQRFKDHEYLLDAMTMIYEWFFKREVNDREARVLGRFKFVSNSQCRV